MILIFLYEWMRGEREVRDIIAMINHCLYCLDCPC